MKLDDKQIEDVIRQQVTGRLGCYLDGLIYVVPISYAYDGCYVYAHTHDDLEINIMRKNTEVCFEVDTMHDMANCESVTAWGAFEELIEEEERNMGFQILMRRTLPFITTDAAEVNFHKPFPPIVTDEIKGTIFRIRLTFKCGRYERDPDMLFSSCGG